MKKKLEKIIFWGGLGVPLVRIGGLGVHLHRPKGKITLQAIKSTKNSYKHKHPQHTNNI